MTEPASPAGAPAEITHLVRRRTEARTKHNWAEADALKAEIEAAGWKVVDQGGKTSVTRAAPPTVEIAGEVRYGSSAAVPSLLDGPATAAATVVILASEAPARITQFLAGLRANAPAGTQVVIVVNDPSAAQEAALAPDAPDREAIAGTAPELLRTSTRIGYAAAINMGLRRAAGEIVILADGSAWPTGDAITPLAAALADDTVAAAGAFGLIAAEPGRLRPGALERTAEPRDVVALEGGWLAFRRSDLATLGPLDERYVTPSWLDVWWSLRLRGGLDPDWTETPETEDQIEAEPAQPEPEAEPAFPGLPAPRRAVNLALPLSRSTVSWPPDRSRLNRRNMYRILDRFGWRDDLG